MDEVGGTGGIVYGRSRATTCAGCSALGYWISFSHAYIITREPTFAAQICSLRRSG